MTVTIDRLASTPAATVPPCPTWCPGDCDIDVDDRKHEKVLVEFTAVDPDAHEDEPRPVTVRVLIERYDTNRDAHLVAEPIRTRLIVEVARGAGGAMRVVRSAPDSDQLRALAVAAFLGGFLLDDVADTTMAPTAA